MNLKQIDAAMKGYEGSLDEASAARLAFFRKLWDVLAPCADRADARGYEPPPASRLRALRRAGETVFSEAPVEVDAASFADALERLGACALEHEGFSSGFRAALERVRWDRVLAASPLPVAGRDPAAYLEALADVLMDDGMGASDARTASILASLALRSQLEAAAAKAVEAIGRAKAREPHPTSCPVCGGLPGLGRVGGESTTAGRGKMLWCPQCGATWEFERVRCARCGTRNQTHLHYFNIEGDEAHRLCTCDECGDYLRTVFVGDALGPFSFEVEDVVMAPLDAIALDPSFAGGASAGR